MSTGVLMALELVLVLGGVVGLAVWELVRLRREQRQQAATAALPPPSPLHSQPQPPEQSQPSSRAPTAPPV